jgi:hypothetical protein
MKMKQLASVAKGLVAFAAISCVIGSTLEKTALQITLASNYGFCFVVFGSVLALHLLVWQFIVGSFAIFGTDQRAFIVFGRPQTSYLGITLFGYVGIAAHCMRMARVVPILNSNSNESGTAEVLIFGLAFGLVLIGCGAALRLRSLIQDLV